METQKPVRPIQSPQAPYPPESTIGNQSYRKNLPQPGAAFALHLSEPAIGDHALHMKIAEKAYELFCRRGRVEGCDLDDWLEAERTVFTEIKALCNQRGARRRKDARRAPKGS